MNDPYDLQRFVDAQDPVYARVQHELAAGRKRTHWMWFVFPQLDGLGHSAMAQRYGIRDAGEARAYQAHPVLGPRLHECTERMLAVDGKTALQILGSPDDLKFRSSMTLFEHVTPDEPLFGRALDRFYAGERDPRTLALLRHQ